MKAKEEVSRTKESCILSLGTDGNFTLFSKLSYGYYLKSPFSKDKKV